MHFIDVITVGIYKHPFVKTASPPWDDEFKFRPNRRIEAADPESITDWDRQQGGRLRNIRLYEKPRFENEKLF